MIENKRGQQMTLTTLILIILGLVVLVLLIFGFNTGFGKLFEKIKGIGGTSNIDSIIQECAFACSSQGVYAFCEENRVAEFGGDKVDLPGTCTSFIGTDVKVVSCPGLSC